MFFFKITPKPRGFRYKPRYWDPEKEEMEKKEANGESKEQSYHIKRGSFRKEADRKGLSNRSKNQRVLMWKLIGALLALIALTIYLLVNGGSYLSLYF